MAELNSGKRKSISERLTLHEELRGHFKGREYIQQHCHLCGWASNGLCLDEAILANKEHEDTHPETAQIAATGIALSELRDSLHDHVCVMAKCACKCGCQDGPFCILIFGTLCAFCTIRKGRGDREHGEKI